MIGTYYENALYEVNEILKYISEENRRKIPLKLLEYIEKNKATNCNFKIDKNVSIIEQKLLPETEAFITIIYRDYLCKDSEKNEINELIIKNDLDFENELKKKYNDQVLFKNNVENNNSNNNLPIIIKKEKLWYRIINSIKEIINSLKRK